MISVVEQRFSTNSHLTTKRLKHSLNFQSVETVRSSNIVEFEFELCHIFTVTKKLQQQTHFHPVTTQNSALWTVRYKKVNSLYCSNQKHAIKIKCQDTSTLKWKASLTLKSATSFEAPLGWILLSEQHTNMLHSMPISTSNSCLNHRKHIM